MNFTTSQIKCVRFTKNTIPSMYIEKIKIIGKNCFPHIGELDIQFRYAYICRHKIHGIIGCALVYDDGFIANVCVDSRWRNKGVGTLILKRIVSQLHNVELKLWVSPINIVAVKVYKRHGFSLTNVTDGYSHKLMVKPESRLYST